MQSVSENTTKIFRRAHHYGELFSLVERANFSDNTSVIFTFGINCIGCILVRCYVHSHFGVVKRGQDKKKSNNNITVIRISIWFSFNNYIYNYS